ncbi:arsenate reductase ArsC [Clostridium baratii]
MCKLLFYEIKGEILTNMKKLKVAFVCVHNSCRSQMAEALGELFAGDIFESYSAGTETKPEINQDAVRIIKELYNVNMNETQKSKLLKDIPKVDVVIKMGCNVMCPYVNAKHIEDWGLEDPTGKSDEDFIKIAKIIEVKVKDLAYRIKKGKL